MNLLYLHGFNSSPDSLKARQTAAWLTQECPEISFHCPLQSPYPEQATQTILEVSKDFDWSKTLVMGSSMGGFYATWLAEKFACKAVLINPAVRPWLGREYLLGEQTNYHNAETYQFEQQHIDALAGFGVAQISSPANFWVLLQTGDEVLDYRQAETFYQGCRITIEQGGDHSFQQFERYLPDVVRFMKD